MPCVLGTLTYQTIPIVHTQVTCLLVMYQLVMGVQQEVCTWWINKHRWFLWLMSHSLTVSLKQASGHYLYKYTIPTVWCVFTSDKCLSNILIVRMYVKKWKVACVVQNVEILSAFIHSAVETVSSSLYSGWWFLYLDKVIKSACHILKKWVCYNLSQNTVCHVLYKFHIF